MHMTDTPPLLFDTHCHLDAAEFAADRDTQVAQARAAGVGEMLVPAVEQANFADTLAMRALRLPGGAGPAPVYLPRHRPAHLEQLADWLTANAPMPWAKSAWIFTCRNSIPPNKRRCLSPNCGWARARQLPVVLHLRRAQDRVLKYLRQVGVPGGIAHAFNGSRQQAEAFIALGFKLGFGGR